VYLLVERGVGRWYYISLSILSRKFLRVFDATDIAVCNLILTNLTIYPLASIS